MKILEPYVHSSKSGMVMRRKRFFAASLPPLPRSLQAISCPTGPRTALISSETAQNANITPCPSSLLHLPWGSPKGGQGGCERSRPPAHRAEDTRRWDTPCTCPATVARHQLQRKSISQRGLEKQLQRWQQSSKCVSRCSFTQCLKSGTFQKKNCN